MGMNSMSAPGVAKELLFLDEVLELITSRKTGRKHEAELLAN